MTAERPPRIVVVGSCLMDLVLRVPRLPRPGETAFAHSLDQFLGGKGFNQAVAARRAGGAVALIGRVGTDPFGDQFLAALAREGIETGGFGRDSSEGTGVAIPLVDDSGQNSIVVAARANLTLRPEDLEQAGGLIDAADALLIQLEIPLAVAVAAARRGAAAGAQIILNAAPATPAHPDLIAACDLLVVNEVEAEALANLSVSDPDEALIAAWALRARGPRRGVIVTLGERGAVCAVDGVPERWPAFRVPVADTIGAGDAFCGALAVEWRRTGRLDHALRVANAAGALAVTKRGSEPSLPTAEAIARLLARPSP